MRLYLEELIILIIVDRGGCTLLFINMINTQGVSLYCHRDVNKKTENESQRPILNCIKNCGKLTEQNNTQQAK